MNHEADNLSQALGALAAADAECAASPAVETALLQAFRAQPVATVPGRVIAFPVRRRVWLAALAAAALMLLSAGVWNWQRRQHAPTETVTARQNQAAPPVQPDLAPKQTLAGPSPETISEPTMTATIMPKGLQPKTTAHNITRVQPAEVELVETEIATEFFPLVATNALPERGRLVRIEVPRSTLGNFGLPINAERADIPIKADLLVGEDGAARAIRFVQEPLQTEAVYHVYGNSLPTNPNPR